MTPAVGTLTFVAAALLYGASSVLFFVEVARLRGASLGAPPRTDPMLGKPRPLAGESRHRLASVLLGLAALGHATYVTIASFVAHVCPVHSVHFMLSVASLLAIGVYLLARRRFRVDALGMLVAPLGLAFMLGTYFLGAPGPEPKLSPMFIGLHVMANLLGVALFLLAGGAAGLYLIQERRLKEKKRPARLQGLPPLDTLDTAVHRFLVAGFPLLTLGIVTGTLWARQLEMGTPDEVMRVVFGYATWLLIAGVLLLRAAAGWRGRRSAYGTIAGLSCALAVLVVYLARQKPAGLPSETGEAPAATTVHGAPS